MSIIVLVVNKIFVVVLNLSRYCFSNIYVSCSPFCPCSTSNDIDLDSKAFSYDSMEVNKYVNIGFILWDIAKAFSLLNHFTKSVDELDKIYSLS